MARGMAETARIVRDQRRRDMIAAIEEFWRASGPDRTYWRQTALHNLRQFRRQYLLPERAAFQAAVRRSQDARV